MAEKFGRYDTADYLETEEDIRHYLDACQEDGDPALIAAALGDIARARNMTALAREVGLTRAGLYKALSAGGNPGFATIVRVARALGIEMKLDFRAGKNVPLGQEVRDAPVPRVDGACEAPKSNLDEVRDAPFSEYDINFARRLAQVAHSVADEDSASLYARRTVLYLSLLATEIALKAMLEQAGMPVADIRARSHRLADLMAALDRCEVEVEVVPGGKRYVPASRLRAATLGDAHGECTVGTVLEAEAEGASPYPNQVRYGPEIRHYPAGVVASMADKVVTFAQQHWQSLRSR